MTADDMKSANAGRVFASGVFGMTGLLTMIALGLAVFTPWLDIGQALIAPGVVSVIIGLAVLICRARGLGRGAWQVALLMPMLVITLMGSIVWHWWFIIMVMLMTADDIMFAHVCSRFHADGAPVW